MPGDRAPAPPKPNILLVILDDIAERDIDSIPTPNFDALAATGRRFRRAYGAPSCAPARWQITFGEFQPLVAPDPCTGSVDPLDPSPGLLSLPKLMEGANYSTALFGKWHLGSWPGVLVGAPWQLAAQSHGYETWQAGLGSNVLGINCPPGLQGTSYTDWYRIDDGAGAFSATYHTDAVLAAFLAWHAAQVLGEPWFAQVAFQAPHKPFHAPPGTSPPSNPTNRDLYELMVTDVDEALGCLLDSIDTSSTVVLVVGDNGTPVEAISSTQEASKVKSSTFEDGIRVPMVWAGPGVVVGMETYELASFVDILPTIAEIVGTDITPPLGRDGVSLVPTLADPTFTARSYAWAGLSNGNKDDFAAITSRWKYRELQRAGFPMQAFLFDLEVDPTESINLASMPSYQGMVAELQPLLELHKP